MANGLYGLGRNAFLNGGINWGADDLRAILVDINGSSPYTVSLTTHEFLSSIPASARIAVGALLNKTSALGTADADDLTWPTVTGNQSEAIVIYRHTGTDATSRLIAYYDVATGLPVLPNGGNITVAWDNGSNKIFTL